MKTFNKNLLITIIVLLADLNTYTVTTQRMATVIENLIDTISASTSNSNHSIDSFNTIPYNFSTETATEKLISQTFTQENRIDLAVDYHNKETGLSARLEKQLYPDNSLDNQSRMECDLSLSSGSNDISYASSESNNAPQEQESDILQDLLNDSACDSRRQEMNENHATQTHNTIKQPKIIREQDLQKNRVYFHWDFGGIPLDSDLMLKKPNVFHDPRSTLSSPVIEARFNRLATFYRYKANLNSKFQSELAFCEALRSGKVLDLFNQIYDPHLPTAEKAFSELKSLWIRARKHLFLMNKPYNARELDFLTKVGLDIMGSAERTLVTRPDYIAKYADAQSLKKIQGHIEYCRHLQQTGNSKALFDEATKLRSMVKKSSDFTTKINFAITQKTYFDPATTALHNIAHAPSREKACSNLKSLELQLLTQAQQQNIMNASLMRAWTVEHYGFDLLEAAQNCYKSRADYVYTPNNQSYLSDTIQPILHNIESKPLPRAHAELVNLEKQIDTALAERNITDPIAQKEYVKKSFGRDVLEAAHKKYEARSDHKQLVESFVDIDVNQASATILENNNSYESVANRMSDLAERIFGNAKLCNFDFVPQIEDHILESLHVIRSPKNVAEFVFHTTVVDHLLTDLQCQSEAIVAGEPALWKRAPELFTHGMTVFISRLNPVTQAKDIAHLGYDISRLLGKAVDKSIDRVIEEIHDPIGTTQQYCDSAILACKYIINTARFTCDTISGVYYLSPEERSQRLEAYCKNAGEIYKHIESQTTAKQIAETTGYILGDVLFGMGVSKVAIFLKEIDAFGKISNEAKIIAQGLKRAVEEHPAFATAEGIALKMSNEIKDVGNTTKKSANALTQTVVTDAKQSVKSMVAETECIVSQTTLNQEAKTLNNIAQEIAKTPNPVAGKIKKFPTFEEVAEHIFSPNHKKEGIMDLGPTERAINDKFVEIIKEADMKNLLQEGPNNIVTKINDKDITIRAFLKDGDLLSYDGFVGLSDRKVNNKIYL